jgi:hypothetical protein
MDESPPVNRNVFAVIFAISILHLVFAITVLLINAASRFGETDVNYLMEGYMGISVLALVFLLGVLIYIGLFLGRSVGLGAPLLEGWAKGEQVRERAVSVLKIALAIGLGVAAAKYLLDLLVFSPFVEGTLSRWGQAPLVLQLPIPFQQGIGDEITYRLFGMTAVVWLIWKAQGSGDAPPGDRVYWAGLLIVGLFPVLGLVLSGVTGLVLLQYTAIILAGAIPFGWLYWKKGIESALVAHFTSSVVLVLVSLA